MLVVFFHSAHSSVGLGGEAGVDIFFVISGFVMWTATAYKNTSPLTFIAKRVFRVVPLYWLFTFALVCSYLAVPEAFSRLVFSTERLIFSLLFVPHVDPGSGKVMPLLVQGWTLHYEMFFYTLVALSLVLSRWWRLGVVCSVLCSLVLVGQVYMLSGPLASVYSDPLLLEFALGMLVGALWTVRGVPNPAASAALASISAVFLLSTFAFAQAAEHQRLLMWGLPGALLILGLLGLERHGRIAYSSVPAMIGDASYSIYLSHTFVIAVIGKAIEAPGDPAFLSSWFLVLATMVLSVGAGWMVHRLVELPVLGLVKGR